MSTAEPDLAGLVAQLDDQSVAFSSTVPFDAALHSRLSGAVEGDSSTAVIVAGPGGGADMRDLGQAVLDSTDYSTVIVRGPGTGAAVSEDYSRAAVETAERPLLAESDYVVGVQRFLGELGSFTVNWPLFAAVVVAVFLVVAVATVVAARRVKGGS